MADNNLVYVDLHQTANKATKTRRPQRWRLILSGDNQKVLFTSSEAYTNRDDAINAAQLAFGPHANVYLREAEHGNVELRLAQGN